MNLIEQLEKFSHITESFDTILKATLLLILSVCGNFLAETLGCQSQKVLENMFVKHLLLFFMIYFTINFTQTGIVVNPIINVFKASIVWIMYHFFTHMDLVPTIIVGLLLMILFFISNYRTYINESASVKKEKAEKVDNALKFTQKILWIILVITILVGSSLYYFEKKKEYGSKFNPLKFIFGVKKCKGNTTKGIFF
jgi:uncharacterized membrane protein YdjX (TVP38/TMEM64 family)|tara:strand:+ start:620 stop:1210 length:591 start_codon:yes stop_codon:yes gene_type:complete